MRWQVNPCSLSGLFACWKEDIKMNEAVYDKHNFTDGPILSKLIRFSGPVLVALLLQATYGAVDLLVVGQFASSADVSAVATGSNIMMTLTGPLSSFAMGITVLLGRQIGSGSGKEGGKTAGAGISLFALLGIILTVILAVFAEGVAAVMHAPEQAFMQTASYIRICGAGILVIVFYNLIGSIFRGIGDSKTPLFAVMIACIFNIFGDLFLVAFCHLGASGAAIATVAAQAVSVVISLLLIRKQALPFAFSPQMIRANRKIWHQITKLGLPLAVSDLLVGISFMIIQAIVNSLGLIPSAGIGVAEKVCAFIMLVPSSFMQSMAAFTAQNLGAGKTRRALKAVYYGIGASLLAGIAIGIFTFFRGDLLCSVFSRDPQVIAAGADYLKSYAIDCLFTAIFFVFIGYYNGLGLTKFVMVQGIISAFGVRVPVSYLMSRHTPVSLFHIGLATPCSSLLQIAMCLTCLAWLKKKKDFRVA